MGMSNGKIQSRLKGLETTKFENQILDAGKAVHDAVMKKLPEVISTVMEPKLKSLESGIGVTIGQHMEKAIGEQVAKMVEARTKDLAAGYEQRLADARKFYEEGLAAERKSQENLLHQIKAMIQSMPVPQVALTVPENAIQVQQVPSQVINNLTVPENAIQLAASQVNLTLPEQPPPQITNNFSVPENAIQLKQQPTKFIMPEKSINVTVENKASPQLIVPKDAIKIESKAVISQTKRKTKVEKSIVYGSTGRPEKVIEETTEE